MAKAKKTADVKVEEENTQSILGSNEFISFVNELIKQDDKTSHFVDQLIEDSSDLIDRAKNSKPMNASGIHNTVHDTFSNSLLNISTNENGTGTGSDMFNQYSLSNSTLNWALWIALYNDSWVFKKAIDKPAEDEVNCGISLHNKGDMTEIYDELNVLKPACIQLLKWGALFGGSVGFMMFKGLKDEEYAKPINFNKINAKTAMSIYVTDRWYGCAQVGMSMVRNMSDPDFGKPMYYTIMFANGKMIKVHHSYILRYEHRDAPRFMKNGMLQGWGYAEGAHILNEITQNDKLKTSIQSLVDKALIEVIKMPGMRGVFMGTDEGNEAQLRKRLEMVVWARNFNSLTFLDKEDEYSQNTFGGLAGLADLLEQNRWQIAAALDMNGILYGDMKSGMGSDQSAMPMYNQTILNRCDAWYRPALQKLCYTIFRKHGIKETPRFTFNPVFKDIVDNATMDKLNKYRGLLKALMDDGIISREQYATSFANYMNNGAISISFTDAEKEAIKNNESNGNDEIESGSDMFSVPSSYEEETPSMPETPETPVETPVEAPAETPVETEGGSE